MNLSGRGPSILLRKTVLSLKSPTGVFIALLRCANANFWEHATFGSVQEKTMKTLAKRERGLDGASPLDKEKHKALYYNKAIRT